MHKNCLPPFSLSASMVTNAPSTFRRRFCPFVCQETVYGEFTTRKISDRQAFEAMLHRARVGCPWRDLPGAYGDRHTIYMRWQC